MSGVSDRLIEQMAAPFNVGEVAASQPILIVGSPRSGTTLLATMLNAHRNVFIANESKLLLDYLPDEDRQASRSAVLAREAEGRLKRDLTFSSGHGPATVAGQLREYFAQAAVVEEKKRWGDKTAVGYRRLNALVRAFPDAYYIVVARDIEEIAASYERINPEWGSEGAIVHWIQCWRAVACHRHRIQLLEVDYAQLSADAETVLRGVCGFIGEDFDPDMLEHHKTERAKALSVVPEFSGVSRPLYRPGRAAPVTHGVRGRLLRAARDYVDAMAQGQRKLSLPRWFGPLTLFVRMRAGIRVLGGVGLRSGIRRIARALNAPQ